MPSLWDMIGKSDDGQNLFRTAKEEYPILGDLDLGYKWNPGAHQGYLESWPEDEEGTPEYPRPKEFPLGTLGIEVFDPKTRPIDIMGDVASHFLKDSDPTVAQHYRRFEQSLTSEQRERLKEQYEHEKEKEGEKRPFEQWYEHSGLPGYFRGYAFMQWKDPEEMYTPGQMQDFDSMMRYFRGKR